MFEKLIALDIGSTSVKLLCTRRTLQKTEIVTYNYTTLDPDSEDRETELREALDRLLADVPNDSYKIVAAFPMEYSLVRKMRFPFSDISKIKEVLPFEAEELLPYPLEEAKLDFQILGKNEEGASVLTAALPASQYEDFRESLSSLKWPCDRIPLEANALYYSLYGLPSVPHNYIQCDIGYRKSVLTVVHNGKLAAARSLPLGLERIIEQLASWQKITTQEAMQLFENLHFDLESVDANFDSGFYKGLKIVKKRMAELYTEAEELFGEICSQIMVTADSLKDEFPGEYDKIFLSGGAASILRISDFFESRTSIPVSRPPGIPGLSDPSVQNTFAMSYGMVSECMHSNASIDFLHDKMSTAQSSFDLSRYFPAMFFGGFALFMYILALLLNLFFGMRAEILQQKALAEQYNNLFKQTLNEGEDPVEKAREMLQKERTDLQVIENILPSDDTATGLISTLTSNFPDDETFVLNNLTITAQSIQIRGTSENSSNLDNFKNRLSEMQIFESVNLNTSASSGSTVNFSLTIKQKQSNTQGGAK